MPTNPQDVLDFWFADASVRHWFECDPAFDARIRTLFGDTLAAAVAGELDHWSVNPPGWLALLIVRDQFSRNLCRGDAHAWTHDAGTQRIALSGLARGDDRRLPALQRVFAYLPLEHSENMDLQDQSVSLFEALHAEVPAEQRARFGEFLDYARRHREVIARYGRFPHRNALLGRTSTPDELLYLARPGAGF